MGFYGIHVVVLSCENDKFSLSFGVDYNQSY